MKQIIIFGLVWPKLTFSAASVRTTGLITSLLNSQAQIHYICPQKLPTGQKDFELDMYDNVHLHQLKSIEDFNSIQKVFNNIKGGVDATIFDSYVAEEKFSHVIHRLYPKSLKILDLQDLHSFRLQRKDILYKENQNKPTFENVQLNNENQLIEPDILGHQNSLQKDIYGRELASIMRSDMVITCSEYEKYYLQKKYNLKNIELLTFFYEYSELKFQNMKKSFDRRKHFAWIGNHSHTPNIDSLIVLTKYIWPQIKQKLPEAQLHIYGSNFDKQISDIQEPSIRPLGVMKSLSRLQNYRALLAPIRFGGGIKGKITDSWQNYLPVVTTPIGSESLYYESLYDTTLYRNINQNSQYLREKLEDKTQQNIINEKKALDLYQGYSNQDQDILKSKINDMSFGGFCNNFNVEDFVENSVKLYQDKEIWEEKVKVGINTNIKKMSFQRNDLLFQMKLNQYKLDLEHNRQNNHLYNITWSETLKSTENFAKYLNQKQKLREFKKQQKHK